MHKLQRYRLAVQHPQAEVAFMLRAYGHHRGGRLPTRLKEDFAGAAAVAAAWVAWDEDHRALAVENHGPTLRWGQRQARRELGEAAEDLIFIEADVMEASAPRRRGAGRRADLPTLPRVDVVASLNFSTFIFHDREGLRDYFRAARRSLDKKGMLIVDAFGGPGAMRVGEQRREVQADGEGGDTPFTYVWEQRSYDAVTGRVDCRIHFEGDKPKRNAFRYDWRLWTLPELTETMHEAGFAQAVVWCDRYDAKLGQSDGEFRPVKRMDAREDWVAYIIGLK